MAAVDKPHVVCSPYPVQDFQFKNIPDGLPPSDADVAQDIPSLCESTSKNCSLPFCNLIHKLNDTSTSNVPLCSSGLRVHAAAWPICSIAISLEEVYYHLRCKLSNKWLLGNRYRHYIRGMKNIRLQDLLSFIRTTDLDDFMLNFVMEEAERTSKASAVILNMFDALEQDVLDAPISPPCFLVSTPSVLFSCLSIKFRMHDRLKSMTSNLWKEQPKCIDWLNSKQPNSVVYVNFGSITVMSPQQLSEFA
ncbi:hypothetical protein L1049_015427 [Liquidambar formosana]|uniref:Uncharacterized protein n=1 Tax=Liquidambar formosana TaxID=63359 RepID=A0AAP0WZR3_LIQFO